MLNLRLLSPAATLALAAGAPGQVRPTLGDLLQQVRTYERNTFALRTNFVGGRSATAPVQAPGLRSDEPQFKLQTQVYRFEGQFEKYDRAFTSRYRIDANPQDMVVQSDGLIMAEFSVSPDRNPTSGLDGQLQDAGHKGPIQFLQNLGTFYPYENDWVQSRTLSELVQQGKLSQVTRSADGLMTFHLSGLTAPFSLTLNTRRSGEIREFGFRLAKNGVEAILTWRCDEFITVQGRPLPTKLHHLNLYREGGKVVTEDRQDWSLSDLSTSVTQASVLKPLPQGRVFQTIRGEKVGRVVSEGGKLHEVENDYGTADWERRQIVQRISAGAGALLVLGLGGWYLLRRKHLKSTQQTS